MLTVLGYDGLCIVRGCVESVTQKQHYANADVPSRVVSVHVCHVPVWLTLPLLSYCS
jgi:hypothetical protein